MSTGVMTPGGQHQVTMQYLTNELAALQVLHHQTLQENQHLHNELASLQATHNQLLADANEKEKKTHSGRKIEIARDPGEYNGSIPKYQEWWTNIRI